MIKSTLLINEMISYFSKDIKRINHLLKVYSFAKMIGELEKVDNYTMDVIELSAIIHDIGIKISEEKYNSSSGYYQQIEGPEEAKKILNKLDIDEKIISRICWLIGKHHTYNDIKDIDYQILIEADFIVNAFEDKITKEVIDDFVLKYFKTKTGIETINTMF